ncbi:chaperone [Methylobacterium sp. Leaf92]|nr:chaperone [Methylobacterium sp. Leaf92]
MSDVALSRAIKEAGGPKALGDAIGISSQAISQWTECPPRRVLAVEAASGVPRHELRPDLYPPPGARIIAQPLNGAAA